VIHLPLLIVRYLAVFAPQRQELIEYRHCYCCDIAALRLNDGALSEEEYIHLYADTSGI